MLNDRFVPIVAKMGDTASAGLKKKSLSRGKCSWVGAGAMRDVLEGEGRTRSGLGDDY